MHFSMNLQGQKGFVEECLESYLTKDHLQASRNAKTAHSPLGSLAKSLTSISLVLLASSSFSFWKLWGAGKTQVILQHG